MHHWRGGPVGRGGPLILLLLALALAPSGCSRSEQKGAETAAAETAAPAYVGRAVCAGCHPEETKRWSVSDHAHAMQPARSDTVLGDFDDARFTQFGVTTRFFRRGKDFFVRTEGPDGKLHDYPVAYTFGVHPLQQYLIPFPGGRMQALTIAWDSRPRAEGGQRWYSLYPEEPIRPGDPLHWTGYEHNWNEMCASCHSTNLVTGYQEKGDLFHTTWSEVDVSCEACHGPGSVHVARARAGWKQFEPGTSGFPVDLRGDGATWVFPAGGNIAYRSAPRLEHAEVETCAPCHSRRSSLVEPTAIGKPLLDNARLALLDSGLYFPDGQIEGEVYVYGSFLQSRMYAAGVTCSDCHDPHSGKRVRAGNALCGGCHRPAHFDTPAHTHHRAGTPGARCVACHMPARTYMGVDVRRDHSFRLPRPDLSVRLGTPNPCTACHGDRSAAWAARQVAAWRGPGQAPPPSFADAIQAGRNALAGAGPKLAALALDETRPGIVRATALELLAPFLGLSSLPALEKGLEDRDPLVRMAAAESAAGLDPRTRLARLRPLLRDPVLAVRIQAGRSLADVPVALWEPGERAALADALAEYRHAQEIHGDRPEAQANLGSLDASLGERDRARREYERALALDPDFVPAVVNLADLLREEGKDPEGRRILERALERHPDQPALLHSLGLLFVRQGKLAQALDPLRRAAQAAPDESRYAMVYGLALEAAGQGKRARAVLGVAAGRHPGDRDLLLALADLQRRQGDAGAAAKTARRILEDDPRDPAARALLQQIGGASGAAGAAPASP